MNPTARKDNGTAKSLNLEQIAELVGGELVGGDAGVRITGVAGLKEAKEGEIAFLSNPKYESFLEGTGASAVITSKEVESARKPLIRTANPSAAFSKIISFFAPSVEPKAPGAHPTAVIDPSARVASSAHIGPHVVIEKNVSIGERSVLEANVFVGEGSSLGADCRVFPNVSLYAGTRLGDRVRVHSGTVLGSDGFGYETVGGAHEKIPHAGTVEIGDDVEIGANVCIDRGRFGQTRIEKGTKIDNLVQIAHNVVIGPHCLIVSQAGISGSSTLGKNVLVAGQAGLVGHIQLGDGAIVGARSGVTKSFPEGSIVLGEPARPIAEQKRLFALIARLPELFSEWADWKKKQKP